MEKFIYEFNVNCNVVLKTCIQFQPTLTRPVVTGRIVSPDEGVAVSFQNTFPSPASTPTVSSSAGHLQRLPPGHLQGKIVILTCKGRSY